MANFAKWVAEVERLTEQLEALNAKFDPKKKIEIPKNKAFKQCEADLKAALAKIDVYALTVAASAESLKAFVPRVLGLGSGVTKTEKTPEQQAALKALEALPTSVLKGALGPAHPVVQRAKEALENAPAGGWKRLMPSFDSGDRTPQDRVLQEILKNRG